MKIGFDAKRAFFNKTGLGNYSRTLITSLSTRFPDHEYFLYSPKASHNGLFTADMKNMQLRLPDGLMGKLAPSIWRSYGMKENLRQDKLDLYHGLSHELPRGIEKTKIPSVVSIHDLIYLRYPEYYPAMDRWVYDKKFRHSCRVADRIIAVSEQTRRDLIEFFNVIPEKITVIYQSCRSSFMKTVSEEEKMHVRRNYMLPDDYLLYVGAISPRKNVLGLVEALNKLDSSLHASLVLVGQGGKYLEQVRAYISKQGMEKQVRILNGVSEDDLPAIFQQAQALVYPSYFEGFGIPLIEALFSKIPVISTNVSALPEAGGPDSLYVEPGDTTALSQAINRVLTDSDLRAKMIQEGWGYAQKFKQDTLTDELVKLYTDVINSR